MQIIASLLFLLSFFSTPAFVSAAAVDDESMAEMERMSKQLKIVSNNLAKGNFSGDDLAAWTKLTIKLKSKSELCSSNNEAELQDLKESIAGLGEAVEGEDNEVTEKREKYEKQKDELNKVISRCNLYVETSEEINNHIDEAEKSYFREKFLVRSPHMVDLILTYLKDPVSILKESGKFIYSHSGVFDASLQDFIVFTVVVCLAILLGLWLRRRLHGIEKNRRWSDEFSQNLLRALLTTLASSAPYLTGSVFAAISASVISYELEDIPFITEFLIGLSLFFIVRFVIHFLFQPGPPAKLFLPLSEQTNELLARRLKVLAALSLIGYLAFYTVFSQSIIESNLMLARNVFSLFFVINVVWTLRVVTSLNRFPKLRLVTWFFIVVILASLITEWLGYRNLALNTRWMMLFTYTGFVVFLGISELFKDLFNAIDEGSYHWTRRLHQSLGLDKGDRVPGLIWIRILMAIIIWGGFIILLISAWDYSGGVIEQVKGYIVNGFDIGHFRIVPSRVLSALLIFALIIISSSWIRSSMENQWLTMTSMGVGARDAVVTITGYVMFIFAALAGLSVMGFDFGNIAIVAGALSVGIGFGLQNIVNNFVSGLILLFERPIRKGDWIVVGQTEGTVKEIQIRATRIQTFDRSDVIVPNSELIANQVTNWVLSSQTGRAIIPVGVAYGTDTEYVRDILLKIAEENDDVINTGISPKPKVLFREFGDSTLNFELRVFLKNVDSRLSVISDINFAIDKAFKEAGIEIPFPQRNLHISSLPDGFKPETVMPNLSDPVPPGSEQPK